MNLDFDKQWPRVVKICGLCIAIWEVVVDNRDRPSILILAGGMMGIQSVVKAARRSGSERDANGK